MNNVTKVVYLDVSIVRKVNCISLVLYVGVMWMGQW